MAQITGVQDVTKVTAVELHKDLFKARAMPVGRNTIRAYGGQIVAQSLRAAITSLEDNSFVVRSLHCYFLKFVDPSVDAYYRVDRIKDGRTFCARTVTCLQNGLPASQVLILFYKQEVITAELFHARYSMPDVPSPGGRLCGENNYILLADTSRILGESVDVYFCLPNNLNEQKLSVSPRSLVWIRPKISHSEFTTADQNFHRAILSYISDFTMASVVLLKYPEFKPGMLTSLDHTIWFHTAVDAKQWHLLDTECEHSIGGSALNTVRVFTENGTLVATAQQESLIRPKF